MRTRLAMVTAMLTAMCCPCLSDAADAAEKPAPPEKTFVVRPIGRVEKMDDCTRIVLDKNQLGEGRAR